MNDTKHEYIGICQFCGAEIKTFDGKRAACDGCRNKEHDGLIVMSNGWHWNESEKLYEEIVKLVRPAPPPPVDPPDPNITPETVKGNYPRRLPMERPEVHTITLHLWGMGWWFPWVLIVVLIIAVIAAVLLG